MKRVALLALLLVLALSGCVSLPESGPVASSPPEAGASPAGTFDYNPEGPRSGDSAHAVVDGFIDAMRESPMTFTAARAFLTKDAAPQWKPGNRTIVYDDGTLQTDVAGDVATVNLGDSIELDARGSWLGDPTHGAGVSLELHLAKSGNSWRITDPPDALIIPRSHFETRFVRYDLHFFDPAAKVLVPEPVYIPAGPDVPTLLVSGLLAGPASDLRSVERTFFPPETRLQLSVPVEDGIADVPLSSELLETDSGQLDLAMAQLAWTLRQVPGVERMRVTVDGTPVDGRTGATARSVVGWSSYDPARTAASRELYGVRDGLVIGIPDLKGQPSEELVSRALASTPVRSLGLSLSESPDDLRLAAVTESGRQVVTAVVPAVPGPDERAETAYSGSNILRPVYDGFDHLWLVDRTRAGARVVVVTGGRQRTIRAPGITGRQVTAFELSRDGTRLAAVVDGQLRLARIERSEVGRPTRVRQVVALPLQEGVDGQLLDVAWITPDLLGVLVHLGPNISQLVFARVDGSYALEAEISSIEPLFERADNLVTAPAAETPVLVQARSGRVYGVSPTGHWTPVAEISDLQRPTFAG